VSALQSAAAAARAVIMAILAAVGVLIVRVCLWDVLLMVTAKRAWHACARTTKASAISRPMSAGVVLTDTAYLIRVNALVSVRLALGARA